MVTDRPFLRRVGGLKVVILASASLALTALSSAAQAAEGSGGLPQLDPATWPSQIFWLVITLVLLYFIVGRMAGPRIASTLEQRQDAIAADLDLAAEYNNRAKEAEAAYNAALESAHAEARTIADKARAEIQERLNAALAEADERIAAQTAASASRLREIEAQAKANAQAVSAEVAAALVSRFSPVAPPAGSVERAVAERISERFGS